MTLLDEPQPHHEGPTRTARSRCRQCDELGWIGEGLVRNFDHVASEPLPPRVRELLARLDSAGA